MDHPLYCYKCGVEIGEEAKLVSDGDEFDYRLCADCMEKFWEIFFNWCGLDEWMR